jgi:hypothetical protein
MVSSVQEAANIRVSCWLLATLLAILWIQSAQLGLSGLLVEKAQREVDRWSVVARPQPMREASRVAGYFSEGLGYAPGNPWALEGLAALDLARMRLSKDPAEALAFTKDARVRIHEALHQRPTSPFLWANLALAKLYLDELDEEFFTALRHADELGPWEPGSQQTVLFASLAAWESLNPAQKRAVGAIVERGEVRNSLKIFEILKIYRRFDLVCARAGYDAVAGVECRKISAPPKSDPPKTGGRR